MIGYDLQPFRCNGPQLTLVNSMPPQEVLRGPLVHHHPDTTPSLESMCSFLRDLHQSHRTLRTDVALTLTGLAGIRILVENRWTEEPQTEFDCLTMLARVPCSRPTRRGRYCMAILERLEVELPRRSMEPLPLLQCLRLLRAQLQGSLALSFLLFRQSPA